MFSARDGMIEHDNMVGAILKKLDDVGRRQAATNTAKCRLYSVEASSSDRLVPPRNASICPKLFCGRNSRRNSAVTS